ncbi:hypothetical protein AWM75_02780 [Aerococcus urinaehominis]|uniref:Uncharacterized protein n=1 Tax=Aerococcus urinaehominis TaxID=128944 RepID=A0A0X8FKI0_9LACT|nr:phosphatase PAP2 family protein [Aerococcus urinaehominis]AMB98987.1 hypothetical protein AWM75_02780 [Aerococcus urinaehominis]SDM38030.1 undecaprenyl-diphosphatase [Aerococcus urinaehominis]
MKNYPSKYLLYWAGLFCLPVVIFALLVLNHSQSLQAFDLKWGQHFYNIGPTWLTRIFQWGTLLGNPIIMGIVIVCLSLILYYFANRRVALYYLVFTILGNVVANPLIKLLVDRPRPQFTDHLVDVSSPSFPSGHSFGAVVIYGCFAYFLCQYLKTKTSKQFVWLGTSLLAIFLAFSRIYLGVHYASDIISGLCLGLAWTLLTIYNWQRVKKN